MDAARAGKRGTEPAAIRCAFYLVSIALVIGILALPFLYVNGMAPLALYAALSSIALSLLFPFAVFSYMLAKGRRLGAIVSELGLSRRAFSIRNALIGLGLLAFVLLVGIALQAFSQLTGLPLPTNVGGLLSGMPLYFLVFSFLVAPINEEILFRGFLVPRIGVVLSAVIFAVPHLLTYSSVAELIASFAFGLIAGYALKKTRSLYPSIIAHMLVNMLTVLSFV